MHSKGNNIIEEKMRSIVLRGMNMLLTSRVRTGVGGIAEYEEDGIYKGVIGGGTGEGT